MSTPEGYFERLLHSTQINFALLQDKRVTIIGVGQVGSQITAELAKCGIGYLLVIDHDKLERHNLYRHALTEGYIGRNKAEGLTDYLDREVDKLQIEALPYRVDPSVSDDVLDKWLSGANLIIAATDDPDAQKRIGLRALANNIPAVFPALYSEDNQDSGEIVVQFNRQHPCYGCWTGFRDGVEHLRGVTLANFRALPVIFTTLMLSIAVLDPDTEFADLLGNGPGEPPNQVFIVSRFGTLESNPLERRRDCPACGNTSDRQPVEPPGHNPSPDIPLFTEPPMPEGTFVAAQDNQQSITSVLLDIIYGLAVALGPPLLGLIVSSGVLFLITNGLHANSPGFGVVVLGFCCAVGFWVSLIAMLRAIVLLFLT